MTRYSLTLLGVLLLSIPAKAQIADLVPRYPEEVESSEPPRENEPKQPESEPTPAETKSEVSKIEPSVKAPHRLNVGYSLSVLSFPFPMRRGPHVSFAITPQLQVGAQYMVDRLDARLAGVRFAGAEEKFWLVQGRWFFTERFLTSFGMGNRSFRLNLLSKQLATALNESGSTHIDVENMIADVGFSHRWVWQKGFVLQADWLTFTIPVSRSRVKGAPLDAIVDPYMRKGTEKAVSILGRTPGVALLGVSAGWTF